MKPIRPRVLAHRGVVNAAGFLFNGRLLGAAESRRRVLACWSPGAQVYRVEDDLLIRFTAPVLVSCVTAQGMPLVNVEGVLLAAPLADDEFKALQPPPGSLVLVRGGACLTVMLTPLMVESPEAWLDVDAFNLIQTISLGAAGIKPKLVVEPVTFDSRAQFKGVPPPSPQMQSVLEALHKQSGTNPGIVTTPASTSGARAAAAELLMLMAASVGWLATGLGRLLSAFPFRLSGVAGPFTRPTLGSSYRSQAPHKPPLSERLSAALRKLSARLVTATPLAKLLGREQARYLMRMAYMFESGDLDDALRHAIPLDDKIASALSSPSLRVPRPRGSLSITPGYRASSSSVVLGDDSLTYLRKLYRASFERLEAQGRIDEAAFVLAELLRANEEAVAFLERHGRLKLAAELAEGRDLPPGLVVRQWFIAGDRARAVAIARRMGAFADAVTRLERGDKKQAEPLRLLWAAALADAGDYAAASEAAWPVAEARRLTLDWMDKAIELGGPTGARMLARKVAVVPEAFTETRERALALLYDESIEGEGARRSFAFTLLRQDKTPASQILARAAARALLRDAGRTDESALERLATIQLRYVIDYSGDASLRADFPAIPSATPPAATAANHTRRIETAATDGGTMPISDAAFLADGRMVVALGEAGVRLLTRDGRTVAHFDQPAHRLVMSDNGDRAIAMAQRGDVWKLARIDFLSRQSSDWCEARIGAFAADYDGAAWFIGADEDLYAIDATAKRFDALWRIPDIEGVATSIARSASMAQFIVRGLATEQWTYQLPQMVLRSRTVIKLDIERIFCQKRCLAISADGKAADQSFYFSLIPTYDPVAPEKIGEALRPELRLFSNGEICRAVPLDGENMDPEIPVIVGNRVAAPYRTVEGMRVFLMSVDSGTVHADISLAGADSVALRLSNHGLTVADSRGRLLVIDKHQSRLLRDLRI